MLKSEEPRDEQENGRYNDDYRNLKLYLAHE